MANFFSSIATPKQAPGLLGKPKTPYNPAQSGSSLTGSTGTTSGKMDLTRILGSANPSNPSSKLTVGLQTAPLAGATTNSPAFSGAIPGANPKTGGLISGFNAPSATPSPVTKPLIASYQSATPTYNKSNDYVDPSTPSGLPTPTTPAPAPNPVTQSPNSAAVGGLVNLGQNNPAYSGNAYDNYAQAVGAQQRLKSGIAQQYGDIESEAIPLNFQQGREQALSRQYASQLDAAQQAVNEQQTGIGLGITGQQTQQSALSSAGGLSAPQSQFGVLTNPQTGQAISGNPSQAAFQGGQIGAQQAQGATYQQKQGALQSARNQTTQLQDFVKANGSALGVNPSDFNAINKLYQALAGQTSNPQAIQLKNLLSGIAQSYASILGYTPDIEQIASQKGGSITDAIASLDSAAQASQAGLQTQGNGSANQTDPLGLL